MYRVLLVDDEALVRDAISAKIRWEELGDVYKRQVFYSISTVVRFTERERVPMRNIPCPVLRGNLR